jgi:peptidoglycan/LPS O-acetylase OafA/YrhL
MVEHFVSHRSRQIILYLSASLLLVVSGYSTFKWFALDTSHPLDPWPAYPAFAAAVLLLASAFTALYRPYRAAKLAQLTAGLGCMFYIFLLCLAFFTASLYVFVWPEAYVMIWLPLALLMLTLILSRHVIKSFK